ncbi:subtilisin-like protein [Durotheca rogersii]|uniref:subtilisin-like protein n=1 Tax=Durotheca rogersii TaxID=419775 RepID=UPI002220EE0B|nr:subtilisin-like protein [Durotheca rogersii]KAI5861047.1 subtilisin-like protein [Durotheca rogersii]
MRVQSTLAPLLGALTYTTRAVAVAAAADAPTDVIPAADDSIVPGAYIVEFEGDDDPNAFYRGLGADGIEVEHRIELKYQLFKGASFTLKELPSEPELTAGQIAAKPEVKSIWPVRKISFPKPNVTHVGGGVAEFARRVKRQQGSSPEGFAPHLMTQVDKLHAEGYTGKGIRIGLVDTGVDYTHPALGGCFGPGCLVEYGYDFKGDNDTSPVPVPDPDPFDNCVGHGTHVAGIIAAQLNEHGFTGAAPGVKLGMYKATGCGGETTNDMLIAAFNAAFEDGSDIISCSAGDDSGWSSDPWAIAASRIAAAGVPVVVAPGNSGHLGLWYPSTPASGINVTAVGSVENSVLPSMAKAATYTVDDAAETTAFGLQFGSPTYSVNVTLPLWAVSNDTASETDACAALPDDTPDLSEKVVLLRMPTSGSDCTVESQAGNLAAKGAQYVLWYSQTGADLPSLWLRNEEIKAVATASSRFGAKIVPLLAGGSNITVQINDWSSSGLYIENLDNPVSGGYMSRSTSWGPTQEVNVKPQVAAPGGDILSTYPLALGGYGVLSGTSMSTPLLAGIFALVAEARGTRDPQTLQRLVAATAKPLGWFDGEAAHPGVVAPVAQQGAGIVQAWAAAHATTLLSASSLSFNDSDHFVGTRTFVVENLADEPVTYVLGHAKTLTMNTFADNSSPFLTTTYFPNPGVDDWAELSFSSDEITVPAGGTVEVTVTLTPPQSLNATLLPVYSGYITLNSTREESLVLPYLGVLGSLHKTPVVQPGWDGGVYLTSTDGHFNIPVVANTTFTINRPGSPITGRVIYPRLIIRPTLNVPHLRADVIALTDTGLPTTRWKGYDVLGAMPGSPLALLARNGAASNFGGRLDDGTVLPEGTYAFLVSGARIFGDASKEEDWDVAETFPFVLKYQPE